MTPARLRPAAEADLVARARYDRSASGASVAERFFDAAIAAIQQAEQMPGLGSPRAGELSGIAGLRVVHVSGFPSGWFYLIRDDHLDVVRLLADAQDLPALLGDVDDE